MGLFEAPGPWIKQTEPGGEFQHKSLPALVCPLKLKDFPLPVMKTLPKDSVFLYKVPTVIS